MTTTAPPAAARLVPSLLRTPALWVTAAAAFAASPAIFLTTLVLGAAVIAIGASQWLVRRRAWPLAVGIGLVAGSFPYAITALVHLARYQPS